MSATDAEKAAKLREAADLLEAGGFSGAAMDAREAADKLDPPQPEYPEGTIARVRYGSGGHFLAFVVMRGGKWCHANDLPGEEFKKGVRAVEVIPTLPPGHVAVDPGGLPSETLRSAAGQLRRQFYLSTAEMLDEIADAQEASER